MNYKPNLEMAENGNLRIHVPIQLKRKAGRKIVLVPEALDGVIPDAPQPEQNAIVEAIAKAHEWAALLESGEVENISVLARKVHLCRSYVVRILSLINLSPELVEAIVYGREPKGLSLQKLVTGFPEDWEGQCITLGF